MRYIYILILVVAACGGGAKSAYVSAPRSELAGGEGEGVTLKADAAPASPLSRAGNAITNVFGSSGNTGPIAAQPLQPATKADPEKLVVEAWMDLRVDDPARTAAEVRARVEAEGGRVVSENVYGPQNKASSAAMVLRVPPIKAAGFQQWLAERGIVESRRVLATDVGKTLFDIDLALKNLDVTMARLQKLAEKDGTMKDLIEVENEMTRVRGQIEKLKGEQRFLLDRVAFATITLSLTREGGPVEFAPHARLHPGAHFSTLTFLERDGRPRDRFGGGATLHIKRWLTFDLDAFPQKGGDSRIIIGTIGTAIYSGLLGGGRRSYLNPYLGLRSGFAYVSDDTNFLLGAEVGLELYKQKYLQIGVAVRGLAMFGSERSDAALHTQLGFEVPF
jgi:hypothetical protein